MSIVLNPFILFLSLVIWLDASHWILVNPASSGLNTLSGMFSPISQGEKVVEIRTKGIDLTYDVTEIEAKAGTQLTIRYINDSETLSHNIVLLKKEEDIRPVGIASLRAVQNEYIPDSEIDRIIAYSGLAKPGETVEFTFTVPPPGSYPYICTYSGHFTMMQGRLVSLE